MELRKWLFERRKVPSHFAKELGKNPEKICRLVRENPGESSIELAEMIVSATGGVVTMDDLFFTSRPPRHANQPKGKTDQ